MVPPHQHQQPAAAQTNLLRTDHHRLNPPPHQPAVFLDPAVVRLRGKNCRGRRTCARSNIPPWLASSPWRGSALGSASRMRRTPAGQTWPCWQSAPLPARLPVPAELPQTQPRYPRGQVGMATPIRQDQKAAVVDHKMQPPDLLARSPADLPIPGFDVRGRPAEAQQGHPLVIDLGHVAEAASALAAVVQVVVFFEQLVEAGPFALCDQPHAHPAQPGFFGACGGSVHAPVAPEGGRQV